MHNPWAELPDKPPYLLTIDHDVIQRFNASVTSDHQIHSDLFPEPFLGNPNAPVVLLSLNPGYDPSDLFFHTQHEYFIKTCKANLRHEMTDYPIYLLNPGNSDAGGYKWWAAHLRRLIEDCGQQQVTQQVFVLEYFGYHSRRYGRIDRIPSQEYGFYLLRKAMERNTIIVQMRSKRIWQKAVPELRTYTNYHELNNPQRVYVSPNNCPTGYQKIVEAIRG